MSVSTESLLYSRQFVASTSPADLEACLQLLHLLFTSTTRPSVAARTQIAQAAISAVLSAFISANIPADLPTRISQMLVDGLLSEYRDPRSRWSDRVLRLNTCAHRHYRKPTMLDVRHVDASAASRYFDGAFRSAAEFTAVMVGAIDLDSALPLIERCAQIRRRMQSAQRC